jgi:hypothetical protein
MGLILLALPILSYISPPAFPPFTSSTAYNFSASILYAASGRVRLQLTASQSESIPPGRYLYDVEVSSSTGGKTRVVEGIATITPQITQV